MRRKIYPALGVLVTIAVLVSVIAYALIKNDHYQLFGEIVSRVETEQKAVALTFDDGPTPERTREILSILNQHDVKATFFLNGHSMEKYPEPSRLLINSGHEIGNHSYSHKRMVFMHYEEVELELESTEKIIRNFGYQGPLYFRPPFGKKLFNLPLYLSNNNIKTITWDVEPETWGEPRAGVKERIRRAITGTKPGSIILMHVMHGDEKSMLAVPAIIQKLKAKGYRFVTISELLKLER